MDEDFFKCLQNRIAEAAVGASALRNQGSRNVVAIARLYLKSVNLADLSVRNLSQFRDVLDRHTLGLKGRFPSAARNWGAARKAINLYLRDILYNSYLCEHHRFKSVEEWLEVPLDSYTAQAIVSHTPIVPKWPGIKHLTPEVSNVYQEAATEIAQEKGIARVHLDVYWWRDVGGNSS